MSGKDCSPSQGADVGVVAGRGDRGKGGGYMSGKDCSPSQGANVGIVAGGGTPDELSNHGIHRADPGSTQAVI